MSTGDTVVLIAAILSVIAVLGMMVLIASLRKQISSMASLIEELRSHTVPLVIDAHRVVDQAATEMERVGAVLESTESVASTVNSASRLAYRAFANPVVKVLAVQAGAAGGVRRLRTGSGRASPSTKKKGG